MHATRGLAYRHERAASFSPDFWEGNRGKHVAAVVLRHARQRWSLARVRSPRSPWPRTIVQNAGITVPSFGCLLSCFGYEAASSEGQDIVKVVAKVRWCSTSAFLRCLNRGRSRRASVAEAGYANLSETSLKPSKPPLPVRQVHCSTSLSLL